MNNPFYDAFNKGRNDPWKVVNDMRNNPFDTLRKLGYSIPENVRSPRDIVQHLMNSGQITQAQVNGAQAAARRMGIRI